MLSFTCLCLWQTSSKWYQNQTNGTRFWIVCHTVCYWILLWVAADAASIPVGVCESWRDIALLCADFCMIICWYSDSEKARWKPLYSVSIAIHILFVLGRIVVAVILYSVEYFKSLFGPALRETDTSLWHCFSACLSWACFYTGTVTRLSVCLSVSPSACGHCLICWVINIHLTWLLLYALLVSLCNILLSS